MVDLKPAFLLAGALMLASGSASGAIASGLATTGAQAAYSGNGELFFAIQDATAGISYTLDLGITLDQFFVTGQPDAGVQRFWALDDTQWNLFTAEATRGSMLWMVMGRDATGGTALGGNRWFTTVTQGQERLLASTTNQVFSSALGETRVGSFYSRNNALGSHGITGVADYTSNGSAFVRQADNKQAYFGATLPVAAVGDSNVRPRFEGLDFSLTNPVGQSSWFYYLTRSGSEQFGTLVVDEFDNLGHDGYWGFTYVEPTVDSPYAGKYLLSYTMQSALVTATQREFANGIGRTEYGGGFAVTRLGAASANALEQPTALLQPLRLGAAMALPLATPVPEPASAWLVAAGMALLGRRAMRRG